MNSLTSDSTLQTVYMILISVAMINYGFMAFQRNPLEQLVSKAGNMKMIIYGLLGLIGVHYMLVNFGLLDDVTSFAEQGYKRAREITELGERYRYRRHR